MTPIAELIASPFGAAPVSWRPKPWARTVMPSQELPRSAQWRNAAKRAPWVKMVRSSQVLRRRASWRSVKRVRNRRLQWAFVNLKLHVCLTRSEGRAKPGGWDQRERSIGTSRRLRLQQLWHLL